MQTPAAAFPRVVFVFLLLGATPLAARANDRASENAIPRSRTFLFTYSITVTGLPAGQDARIWLPVPSSSDDQDVNIVSKNLPGKAEFTREPKDGNRILYVESQAGKDGTIPLSVIYRVTRREVKSDPTRHTDDRESLSRWLKPDVRVPLGGKPMALLKNKKVPRNQVAAARLLYDVVDDHMRYSKEGTGWGQGDAVWACDSGYGNCTDFHSLFISLARSLKIPAKFEIGFPLPEKHGSGEVPGYHCWAKFRPEGAGWIPVDISEANKNPRMRDYYFGNLTPDRVAFSTGRDIDLVPKQQAEPLNFFIYPHVEVDGKVYTKVQRKFTFQDVPATKEK